MEKKRPVYNLYGTAFVVDVDLLELRQKENPNNTISFLDMEDKGTHYLVLYDKVEKKQLPFEPDNIDPNHIVAAIVPPLKELDPEGMALRYGCTVQEMAGKTDYEIMVHQDTLLKRLAGELPQTTIYGHTFYFDWRLKELRAKDDMQATPLNFKNMAMNSDGTAYICAYHIPTKSEYHIDVSATKLPENVVFLEIPYELKFDPVGVAREYGLEDTALLRRFPIPKVIEVKVTPLSETELPMIIAANLKKAQTEKQEQQPQERKGKKIK